MDYKEEQQSEIDALDSIYCGEMTSNYTLVEFTNQVFGLLILIH